MSLRSILACGLCLGLITACLGDDMPTWDALDWRLDRGMLVSRYLFHDQQPEAPWEDYVQTLGPDETPLADLLTEFDALDPAVRHRAELAAADLLVRGRRVVLEPAVQIREISARNERLPVGDFSQQTPGFATAVTTAIDRLARAVRRDPTLAEAWYHLAYFAGLAGDRQRQERAQLAFLAVWPRLAPEERSSLSGEREVIILERAWALREAGRGDECLQWLADHRDELSTGAEAPAVAPADEARLIGALVHAERGEVSAAQAALPHLPVVGLPHRATAPQTAYVSPFNQRGLYYDRFMASESPLHKTAPDIDTGQSDKMAHERRESRYLQRWVKGWIAHARGLSPATIRREMGRIELEMEYSPRLAWRFWQDQGVLYEQMGEYELAQVCWARAAVYRPYFFYHPTGQGRGIARVHGLPATGQPYFLAYGTFFMAGSLWSYAANAALASEVEPHALERMTLRRVADESLEACIRRGVHADAARALRGRLAFLDERYAEAAADLDAAWKAMSAADEAPPMIALMLGLCHFNAGQWVQARPWLQAFCDRSPEAAVGWLALGLARAQMGHDAEAFACLDEAVRLGPDDPTALYNRGLLHYRLRRRDAAREDFLRARELWPDNPQIARMVEVVAEEVFYDLQVTATPMRAQMPPEQRQRLAQLRAAGGESGLADALADMVSGDPDRLGLQLDALRRRHADSPTPYHRQQLAQALFLADELDEIERMLAPAWPEGLVAVERRLLLYADRHRGRQERALMVATAPDWPTDLDDVDLLVLATTILLEHDRRAEARVLVARGLALSPGSLALQELQTALERSR